MMLNEILKKKVGFISLGCDKNRVDLEEMIYSIKSAGFEIVNQPHDADILIINTCAFLESARMEAIENILEMSQYKTNKLQKLIVTGCLNELNYTDLQESLPEVDAFVNIKDNENIVSIIANLYDIKFTSKSDNNRILTTPNHYAYLKISEGCNNFCTYCLIPYIRGRYRSRKIEELVSEAKTLANKGVSELILVAQDVTKYGVDLYKKKSLVTLIKELSKINQIKWIRLLYCYPEEIDDDLINEIKNNEKLIKYLDVPLQHISTNVLKQMNRRSTKDNIYNLFTKLQSEIPKIVIRTTFIVGFPGETDKDVQEIEDFLNKFKLQNVGFFKYSREEGTKSYSFDNQVEDSIKEQRLNYLANVQYQIQSINNNKLIGNVVDAIVDYTEYNYSVARYFGQAPQIDSVIYIDNILPTGEFYKIKIVDKFDYDLKGELYEHSK